MLPLRFLAHSIKINTLGGVAAWIDGIQSYSPDQNVALFEEGGGSEIDREFVATKEVAPSMPIETTDLSFIATCGLAGIPINCDDTHEGLTAFGREILAGSVPTPIATEDHIKMSVTDGLLVPVTMRAGHNQIGKLGLMLHTWLGSGDASGVTPMVFSASNAIPTGASQTSKEFCAGPIKFGSRLCQGIMDLAVAFGIEVFKEGDTGDVYQSIGCILARYPKIEFSTRDTELITEIGDGISITTFAAYFRKIAANGQRVANGTAQHVSASGTAGMITPGATGLKYRTPGTSAFTYTPAKNTVILTLSAAATIPTT